MGRYAHRFPPTISAWSTQAKDFSADQQDHRLPTAIVSTGPEYQQTHRLPTAMDFSNTQTNVQHRLPTAVVG